MAYRLLGAAHFLVAILLLPISAFFGLLLVPLLALGPIWLVVIGIQLCRSANPGLCTRVRTTHFVTLAVALLLCFYGVFALRAAERSAAAGGGLLGGFGLIPLGIGIALAALSVASLGLVRQGAPPD
jgi:hypothetical protein